MFETVAPEQLSLVPHVDAFWQLSGWDSEEFGISDDDFDTPLQYVMGGEEAPDAFVAPNSIVQEESPDEVVESDSENESLFGTDSKSARDANANPGDGSKENSDETPFQLTGEAMGGFTDMEEFDFCKGGLGPC